MRSEVVRVLRQLVGSGAVWAASLVGWCGQHVLRAAQILRRAGLRLGSSMLGATLLAGAAYVFGLGALPALAALLMLGVGVAASVGRARDHSVGRLFVVGLLLASAVLPACGAVLVGSRLAEVHGEEHFLPGWALFVGVIFLGTSVLVPAIEASAIYALGRGTVLDALTTALLAAGRRGILRTLLIGGLAAAFVSLVPLLDALGPVRLLGSAASFTELTALELVLAGSFVSAMGLALLGATLATEPLGERARSGSAFTFVTVGLCLLAAGTIAGAILVPTPLVRPLPPDLFDYETGSASLAAAVVPRPGGMVLEVRYEGELRAAVPVPPNAWLLGVAGADDGSRYVLLNLGARQGIVQLDASGRHVDDPLMRIEAHVGVEGALVLLAALFMVLFAAVRARRSGPLFGAVRRGEEVVLHGRLRADEGTRAPVRGGVVEAGAFHFDAVDGAAIVALPPSIAALGAPEGASLEDGTEIALALPRPIATPGFRQGSDACPTGAVLILPNETRLDALVGRWALRPATPLLAVSSIAVLSATILSLGGAGYLRARVSGVDDVVTPVATDPTERSVEGSAELRALHIMEAGYGDRIRAVSDSESLITADVVQLVETLPLSDWSLRVADLDPHGVPCLVGFQSGDLVVAWAGVPVTDQNELRELIEQSPFWGTFGVRVLRDGEPVDLVFRVVLTLPR